MSKRDIKKRLWKSMSKHARHVFKATYKGMKNQAICIHRETHPLHKVEWDTIRHNAAFIAACAVDHYRLVGTK